MWNYLAQYCYLPRLYSQEVLLDAIRTGICADDAPFAYADRVGQDDKYQRLIYRASGQIYFDDSSVLVRPEVAQAQLDAERVTPPPSDPDSGDGKTKKPDNGTAKKDDEEPTPAPLKRRYHASVTVDPHRVNKEVGTIVEEVIEHLTSLAGAGVTVTLEISASSPQGFPENTVRIVRANSQTLKFDSFDFEED